MTELLIRFVRPNGPRILWKTPIQTAPVQLRLKSVHLLTEQIIFAPNYFQSVSFLWAFLFLNVYHKIYLFAKMFCYFLVIHFFWGKYT